MVLGKKKLETRAPQDIVHKDRIHFLSVLLISSWLILMSPSKQELRKMFLRVLYECLHGTMKSHSWGVDSIVPSWINKHYKIKLTNAEIQSTHEAIQELKNSGYLVRDASQSSDNWLIFTEKGLDLVRSQKDPEISGLRLEEVVSDQQLLQKCLNPFNDGDYETAIFAAFKHVEERVRVASRADVSEIGVPLMTFALHPQNGKLIIPKCKLTAEQEGVYNLFKGAIQFFKNPSSHRTVDYEKKVETIKIIAFADLLLKILSSAQQR